MRRYECSRESHAHHLMRKCPLTSPSPPAHSPDLSGPLDIAKPDWETFAQRTAELIATNQTPEQLLAVRGKLYDLLVHAIPATLILKTILDHLLKRVDDSLRAPLVEKAAFYVSSSWLSRISWNHANFLRLAPATPHPTRHKSDPPPRSIRRASHVAHQEPRHGLLSLCNLCISTTQMHIMLGFVITCVSICSTSSFTRAHPSRLHCPPSLVSEPLASSCAVA